MKISLKLSIIIICFIVISCASNKIKTSKVYELLNVEMNHTLNRKKDDTIYISKVTINYHLKKRIKNKKLITKTDDYDLIKILSDAEEIKHLTSQLKDTFLIDFRRIKSKRVKEYIDPFKRLDSAGNVITDYYYIKVFGSRKYTLSKPIFTKNNSYSFIMVSAHSLGIQIQVFKKEDNKWKHYKYISYPY